jgi:hypothetical protein
MNATGSAKTMPDYLFIKLVRADVFIGRMDSQLLARGRTTIAILCANRSNNYTPSPSR